MDEKEIFEKVKTAIIRINSADIDEDEITLESYLGSRSHLIKGHHQGHCLGIHSLGRVEIIIELEREFRQSIPNEDAEKLDQLQTQVKDIVEYFKNKLL